MSKPRHRVTWSLLSTVLVALLTSCTSAPQASPTPLAASATDVCWELSDLGTLVFNMQVGKESGRIPGEEYQGAMYLAASMLKRVDASDDADLNVAVQNLKSASGAEQVDPYSEAWTTAFQEVSTSCTAVLGEFGVRGWVGG